MTEVVHHRKAFRDRIYATVWRNGVEKDKMKNLRWRDVPRSIAYRIFRWLAEITAIIISLACLWFTALNILISQQSVDITVLKPNAQMWFSQAFNGSDAQIGDMKLSWLPASNNIAFEARNVVITDTDGRTIETIPRLQTEIPVIEASKGVLIPKRLVIDGGSVTWLRDNNGGITAGLGTPNTVGKLGPVWRGKSNGGGIYFNEIGFVTITNATAYIIDDTDGLELTLKSTNLDLNPTPKNIEVSLVSTINKNDTNIPLKLKMIISSDLKDYAVDIKTAGLNLSIISPKRGRFSVFKDFNAELDIEARLNVDRVQGLSMANVDVAVGNGHIQFGEFEMEFDEANIDAVLSAESQNMAITNIGLVSKNISFSGSGTLSELGAMTDGNINSSPVFDLALTDVILDRTPTLPAALTFQNLDMSGHLDLNGRELRLDRVRANLGDYEANLSGKFTQNEKGDWSQIAIKGRTSGTLNPRDILSIWPEQFAEGARSWIKRSILKASLKNLIFESDFREQTLRTGIPNNEELTLTFDVTDADVRYITTMTPYTNVSGKGILRGNSIQFEAFGGNVGALSLTKATVDIPRLQPHGGDLIIKLNGKGSTADMLSLIDQKPFEYPSQFGVEPSSFEGQGVIDMTITRPLLVYFDRDRIQYDISGRFSDVTSPVKFGSHKVKNGEMLLIADKSGMTIKGPIDIGPWQTELNWYKAFDYGKTPTKYQIVGRIDRDTLDRFGVGFREYFEGDIDVKIDAQGTGLDLNSANITADLTQTAFQMGAYWSKVKGSPANFTSQLKRKVDGNVILENMNIRAPGLDIHGHLNMASNLKLLDLDLPKTKIAGLVDAGVQVKPDELDEKLSIFISGQFLDVSQLVSDAFSSGNGGIDIPILLTAHLQNLALNEGYVVSNARALFSHNGVGITNLRMEGEVGNEPIKIQMRSIAEEQTRKIDVDIPDASIVARAFLNLDSIEGGRLMIGAELPLTGTPGALLGVAQMEDFKLVKAPILAQMLSIGSLTGIVDTLSGEGLSFDTFYVPFSLRKGELNIRDARVSGPALGMTGDGEIRFKDRLLDLDGALVPAYTANSLLGDIPLIGDVFVRKKGEGIFALSYKVQGEFDETQISVNPLSALTPGFLRGIFKPKRDKLSDETLAEIKSVAPN